MSTVAEPLTADDYLAHEDPRRTELIDGVLVDLTATRAPRMPELAAEVRSPATWVYDVGQKRDLYDVTGCGSCGWPTPPAARCSSTAAAGNRAASTSKSS